MFKKFLAMAALVVVITFLFQAQAQKSASPHKAWTEGATNGAYKPSVALTDLNSAFKELARAVAPTVVNILTSSKVNAPGMQGLTGPQAELFKYFFGNPFGGPGGGMGAPPQQEQSGAGSGFIINKEGLVVTNSHVVRMNNRVADQIQVKFLGENDSAEGTTAEVVGVDPLTDVAVLRLKGLSKEKLADLRAAPFGTSDDVAVGEIVFAVGNPYGHTHSVTQGIVSALGREVDINASNFIQTDASINPGNSGGPLFNIKGEVIGINTAIDARAQGIGFAIPINSAKRVIEQLVEKGSVTWGYVGVSMQPLDEKVAKALKLKSTKGALIVQVEPNGPAARSGLRSYDVITKLNGKDVASVREVSSFVRNLDPGAKATVEFVRDGVLKVTSLVIGKRQEQSLATQRPALEPEGPQNRGASVDKLGLGIEDLTPAVRDRHRIPASVQGVRVVALKGGGLAEQMGIRVGDVVIEINQKQVKTTKEVEPALALNKTGILLKVLSKGSERVLSVEFGE